MGAWDFNVTKIAKTPKVAYNEAVEGAEYEHGHDGYNGTISTTAEYYFFDKQPRWWTKKFDDWEDKILEEGCNGKRGLVQKWGACGCVEVKGKAAKEIKEVNGLKGKRGLKVWYFFGWAAC